MGTVRPGQQVQSYFGIKKFTLSQVESPIKELRFFLQTLRSHQGFEKGTNLFKELI